MKCPNCGHQIQAKKKLSGKTNGTPNKYLSCSVDRNGVPTHAKNVKSEISKIYDIADLKDFWLNSGWSVPESLKHFDWQDNPAFNHDAFEKVKSCAPESYQIIE